MPFAMRRPHHSARAYLRGFLAERIERTQTPTYLKAQCIRYRVVRMLTPHSCG
jgi:hypothetical protein